MHYDSCTDRESSCRTTRQSSVLRRVTSSLSICTRYLLLITSSMYVARSKYMDTYMNNIRMYVYKHKTKSMHKYTIDIFFIHA